MSYHSSTISTRSSSSCSSIERLIQNQDSESIPSDGLKIHCKTDTDTYILQTPGGYREVNKDALEGSRAGEILLLAFDFRGNAIPFLSRCFTRNKIDPNAPLPFGAEHDTALRIVAEGPRNDYFCWEEDKVRYFLVSVGDTTFQSSHHSLLKSWPGRVLLYDWPVYSEGVFSHVWRDVKKPLAKMEKRIKRKINRELYADVDVEERTTSSFDLFRRPSLSGFRSPSFLKRPDVSRSGSVKSGSTRDSNMI